MRLAALLVAATITLGQREKLSPEQLVVSAAREKYLHSRVAGGSKLPCRALGTGKTVVIMGDSHMRELWTHVQHAVGCNMSHISKADSYGNTFVCRAPSCNTSLVFMWSVSPIRIEDLSASDNCTYAASLDCRAQGEISEYVRSGCKASAPQLLKAELARLRLGVPDLIVSNLPQWLLSAEGLHNGQERPRDYAARAQHAGCVTQFKDRMLASYLMLHSAATHGLVICHHLDLARWGGRHLEALVFGPLEEHGVPVVRMQDAWRQTSDSDSHIRSPAVNLEMWQRVVAAARGHSLPRHPVILSSPAKEGRYTRLRSIDYGHWERAEKSTVPGANVLKNGSFLACTSGDDRFRHVQQGTDVLKWKYWSMDACGGPCASIGPRDAQNCLANLWIHLDGDSITRDMYFDLLDLLDPQQSATCSRAKLHHGTGFTAATGTLITLGWNFGFDIQSKLNSSSTSWAETAESAAAHDKWRHHVRARRADVVAPDVWTFSPGLWFGAFGEKLDRHLYKEVISRVLRDAEAHRNTTAFYLRTVTPYARRRGQIDDDHAWMYEYGRAAFPEQSRVIDAWQVLSPRKGELAMPDGVHYSGVGSKTLTNLLLNMLCRQKSGEPEVAGRTATDEETQQRMRSATRRPRPRDHTERGNVSFPEVFVLSWHTRHDRRQRLQQAFGQVGWPTSRIQYVCGSTAADERRAGQLGLSWAKLSRSVRDGDSSAAKFAGAALSHITALQRALDLADDLVVVLEDDFTWDRDASTVRSTLAQALNAPASAFDVFLLACNPKHECESQRPVFWGCALGQRRQCQTTSGYVIRRTYIPVLLRHWIDALELVHASGSFTNQSRDDLVIDQSWKALQRRPGSTWLVAQPVLGRQAASFSDIEGRFVNYGVRRRRLVASDDPEACSLSPEVLPVSSRPKEPAETSERRVISYSLYNGHLPRYAAGALANLELWKKYFPGWEMWVYCDETTPKKLLAELEAGGVKVIDMSASGLANAMTWRFTVASDPSVARYVIRDIDSRLNQRDKDAIDEWCASDKKFHIIRDHPAHSNYPMSGGLWGGTKDAVPNMVDLLQSAAIGTSYVADIHFLTAALWGQAQRSVMQHDSFSCDRYGGRSFPTPRQYPEQHVGSVHLHAGAKERKVDSDMLIAAIKNGEQPARCRDRGMAHA